MPEPSEHIQSAVEISDKNKSETLQPVISAPTLVCNIGIWPKRARDPQDTKTLKDYTEYFKAWCGDLNSTIERIIAKQDASGNSKFLDASRAGSLKFLLKEHENVPFITNPFIQFKIIWKGTPVHCLIETHFDYVNFSFFADLANPEAKGDFPAICRELVQDAEAKKDLSRVYEEFWAGFINTPNQEDSTAAAENAKGGASWFSWQGITGRVRRFFARQEEDRGLKGPDLQLQDGFFPGEIFAHQFGLVALCDGGKWDGSLKPFAEAIGEKIDKRNVTASTMLQKNACFIAGVGKEVHKPPVLPTHWVLLVLKDQDPGELGRLVADINAISTVRRVALREFLEFRRFGSYIRIHGHEVDESSRRFNTILDKDSVDIEDWLKIVAQRGFNPRRLPELPEISVQEKTKTVKRLTKDTRVLQNNLCKLESELYRQSAAFTGGMSFRVSRSKYYAQQFRNRLKALNMEDIRGYQSYSLFIQRRVEPLFAYISDVGDRAKNLRERLSSILTAIQSKTLVDLTKNIEILSESIAGQAAMGELQARFILFLTVFVTLSQVMHSIVWNNLANKRDSAISKNVTAAENKIQGVASQVFKCGSHYYSRYWEHSTPANGIGWFDCGPQEPVSVTQDTEQTNNDKTTIISEARSSAFSYSLSFIVALFVTLALLIPKFIKWVVMILWRILKSVARLPGIIFSSRNAKSGAADEG